MTFSTRASWPRHLILELLCLVFFLGACQPLPTPSAVEPPTASVSVAITAALTRSATPLSQMQSATGTAQPERNATLFPGTTPEPGTPAAEQLPQSLLDGYLIPKNCWIQDISPDYTWILLGCDGMWVENLRDGRRIQLATHEDFPDGVFGNWSPDGSLLVLSDRLGTWLFHTDNWQTHQLLYGQTAIPPGAPMWAPNSRFLMLSGRVEGEILAILGVDGSVRPLLYDRDIRPVPKLFMYGDPEWAPDSRQIAYLVLPEELVGKLPNYFEAWVIDIATGVKRKLLDHVQRSLMWSPDGTKIALHVWDSGEVAIVDPVTLTATHISRTTGRGWLNAKWSPDGTRITLQSESGEVVIVDPVTLTVTNIPKTTGFEWLNASWSPDSRRLALSSKSGVFITSLDGTVTQITRQSGDSVWAWTTDGRYLIVQTSGPLATDRSLIKAIRIGGE